MGSCPNLLDFSNPAVVLCTITESKSLAYLKGDLFSIKNLDEVLEDTHGVLSER